MRVMLPCGWILNAAKAACEKEFAAIWVLLVTINVDVLVCEICYEAVLPHFATGDASEPLQGCVS
jgi:hypothetical protein